MDDVKRIVFLKWADWMEVWLLTGEYKILRDIRVTPTIQNRTHYPVELEDG